MENQTIISLNKKKELRLDAFRFLSAFGTNIKAKFGNICGKTGQYSVPSELYQKRTPRKNRCLISWQTVKANNLTLEQLETFEGGVVVEFVNNDFFNENDNNRPLFLELKNRLGSDDNVSAIITIRSEAGSSSSAIQRVAFKKLINNTTVNYHGNTVTINKDNYDSFAIKQDITGKGQGNETWSGFLYVSIRGGQQDTIQTHAGIEYTLFNPACEYASTDVCEDINLVMAYYALVSIDEGALKAKSNKAFDLYQSLMRRFEEVLKGIEYESDDYCGNLYDSVRKQYSVSFNPGHLTDPIQLIEITIDKFNISERVNDSIDFTHSEAVVREKYYWDKKKQCILSPARPTNIFWSYHLSNMMQQDYDLDEYFEYEKNRYEKRQKLIAKSK